MRRFIFSFALLWLRGAAIAAVKNNLIDLEPLPRHACDKDALRKRQDAAGSVMLQDHEQFMWTSGNGIY